MFNLNKLSKIILKKMQNVLTIVLEYSELKITNKDVILIPKERFKDSGLSISEVIKIINKIGKEENEAIKNIEHIRPFGPKKYPSFIQPDLFNSEREYEYEKKEFKEKYEDNLEISISDSEKIRKLLKRVIEKQNWLVCDNLKFNIHNGDTICGKIETNFQPETQGFKLLKALMESPNINLSYTEINKILTSDKDKRDVSFVIRDIKEKLKMTGKKKMNKNKFRSRNGYQIVCSP